MEGLAKAQSSLFLCLIGSKSCMSVSNEFLRLSDFGIFATNQPVFDAGTDSGPGLWRCADSSLI